LPVQPPPVHTSNQASVQPQQPAGQPQTVQPQQPIQPDDLFGRATTHPSQIPRFQKYFPSITQPAPANLSPQPRADVTQPPPLATTQPPVTTLAPTAPTTIPTHPTTVPTQPPTTTTITFAPKPLTGYVLFIYFTFLVGLIPNKNITFNFFFFKKKNLLLTDLLSIFVVYTLKSFRFFKYLLFIFIFFFMIQSAVVSRVRWPQLWPRFIGIRVSQLGRPGGHGEEV
jgi:hypothetical protein